MTKEEAIIRLKEGEPFSEIYDPVWNEALDMAISALSTPEREKGEWIDISTGRGIFKSNIVKCSLCGNTLDVDGVNCGRGDENFCPNCGADMRKENI